MPQSPDLQLHGSQSVLTDRSRIDEANQQNVLDINDITSQLNDIMAQGLGLYTGSNNTQADYNTAFNNAQNALNDYAVNPGTIDTSNYNPYMNAGAAATNRLADLLGAGTNGLTSQQIYELYLNNPAVQAQMNLGNQQVMANASANGLINSGAVLKALNEYGQGVAAQTLGQNQDNLYKLAQLGAQASSQYAATLAQKYSVDQQTALGAKQNQTNLIGQQANLLNTQNTANNSQLSLLGNLGATQANIAAQAASQRQSSLAGSATKSTDQYGMGYGGIMDTLNTSFGFSGQV